MSNLDALQPFMPGNFEGPRQNPSADDTLLAQGTISEGARNDTLFREACSLQARGLSDEEIRCAIVDENMARCCPPLNDAEVSAIVEHVISSYPKGADRNAQDGVASTRIVSPYRPNGAKLLHNKLARDLIDNQSACFIGGAPAIWNGQRFAFGWGEIDRAANRLDDAVTMRELKEVQGFLNRNAPHLEPADPKFIAFENGVLDIETGELLNATNVLFVPNVIPHDYDPDAYDKAMDDFLWAVSCGDPTTRKNLEETAGLCCYRGKICGQSPLGIGDGGNGKSAYLNALTNMLGPENVSSLDIADMGKQFHVGCLVGKLANIGDDISNARLQGDSLSVFKKAATGDRLHVDVKQGTPYDFVPYVTLIFSCNEFPSLGDSTKGMMCRLFPIPFNAHFSPEIVGFDPKIEQKLKTESAAKYLCRLAIEGLRRLLENSGFTPNEMSRAMIEEIEFDNNNILMWLEECGYNEVSLLGEPIPLKYEEYKNWCINAGLHPKGHPGFTKFINKRFGFISKPEKVGLTGAKNLIRVFAKKE